MNKYPRTRVLKRNPEVYGRHLTPDRLLASRFLIWALERAIALNQYPRDHSIFKIELEFRPSNFYGANSGRIRAPLAERLSRIYRRIVYGGIRESQDQASLAAVQEWLGLPEIKPMIAEKVLVGDA